MSDYDFILNSGSQSGYTQPNNSSVTKRIMVVLAGLIGLTLILVLVFGVLLKPNTAAVDRLAAVSAKQADLISIATQASSFLKTNEGKALANGAKLVMISDQQAINGLLADAGRSVTEEEQALAFDQEFRTELDEARRANRYDDAFATLLEADMLAYRQSLQTAYNDAVSQKQRDVINQAYANVSVIFGLDQAQEAES